MARPSLWSEFLETLYAPPIPKLPEQHEAVLEQYGWGQKVLEGVYDVANNRQARYIEYDEMDQRSSDISVALDMVADEATAVDPRTQRSVWVQSDSEEVVDLADALLERIEIEENAREWVREMTKFGELVRYNVTVSPEDSQELRTDFKGILALEEINPLEVLRLEDRGRLLGFRIGLKEEVPPWQITHMRLPGRVAIGYPWQATTSYGRSYLEGARSLWRSLKVAEDSVLLARIDRAIRTIIFPVLVENVNPIDIPNTLNKWRRALSRFVYQNPQSGEFTQRYNPFGREAEIYWPVVPGQNINVQELGGEPDIKAIEDLRHWRDKMLAILRIPKEFLQADRRGGGILGKDLSLEDIRFARLVRMVQRSFARGIARLIQIELSLHDISPDTEFKVQMSTVSFLEEAQRLEVLNRGVEMSKSLTELGKETGLDQTQEWQAFVLDTVIAFVGSSLGIEQLKEEIEAEKTKLVTPGDRVDGDGDGEGMSGLVHSMMEQWKNKLTAQAPSPVVSYDPPRSRIRYEGTLPAKKERLRYRAKSMKEYLTTVEPVSDGGRDDVGEEVIE